ncbi:hypothetical protein MASR1M32_22610 [Rhodobacter sp.]
MAGGPAQKLADRQADGFAEDVPAGDVQRGLGVVMPDQRLVHCIVDPVDLTRIAAQKMRGDVLDPGAGAARMRGDIGRTEGRAFPPAFNACIRLHPHDGRIEAAVFAPARQKVDPAGIGQMHLVKFDFADLHASTCGGISTSLPVWDLDRKSRCACAISDRG